MNSFELSTFIVNAEEKSMAFNAVVLYVRLSESPLSTRTQQKSFRRNSTQRKETFF